MPLMTDFDSDSALVGTSLVVFAGVVVRCDNPKYHLIRPISSTPPAVPSISGKRSMRG